MAFLNHPTHARGVPRAEINMIPLIDVMLVLLVIFMVTAPLLTHAVKLELPRANSHQVKASEKIEIAIDAENNSFWNGELIASEALTERLRQLAKMAPETEVHLHADKNTRYERIAVIMAEASRSGLKRIGFVTQQAKMP